MTVRTRFAPSPTGYMHVGNLRTALYAYLLARHNGGKFILRIEDTDQERYVEGAVDVIYDTLKANGMYWDEGPDVGGDFGPYIQSERRDMYMKYALKLVDRGEAYYCFCTKERLDSIKVGVEELGSALSYDGHCSGLPADEVKENLKNGVPFVIRQKMPKTGTTTFHDAVFGDITVENGTLDDQILIKGDGLPTYNFANVVDDHTMGITHIVRGSEYLSSTPKYNLLYEAFGWNVPVYIHCSPVMKDATQKLSKRNGDASFEDLIKKGYLKEAVLNYIALLGWSPGGEREKFTLEELTELFDVSGISKSPAIFDTDKLKWLNSEYIRAMSPEKFHGIALPYIRKGVKRGDIDTALLASTLHQRTEVLSDIPEKVDFLDSLPEYDNELYFNKKMKTDPETSLEALNILLPVLEGVDDWTVTAIHDTLMAKVEELGVKTGWLLWPLRVAASGKPSTPGGGIEIAAMIGKTDTIDRINKGITQLSRKE